MRMWLISIMFLFGCVSTGPKDVKELGEDFTSLRGRVVAPPVLENSDERMILYIEREEHKDGEDDKSIIVGIATNHENDTLLKILAKRLSAVDEPVFIFGKKVEGKYEEFLEGIDFEIYAIGYWDNNAHRYMTVITTYGDRLSDVLSSIGWSNFLKNVGKKAIDVAL